MSGGQLLFYAAAFAYLAAGWMSINEVIWQRRCYGRWLGTTLLLAAACIALAIGERWLAYGQGPFLTMYEVLISSLFSLSLVYGVASLAYPVVRVGAPFAVGIMLLLFLWALNTDPGFKHLPPTYQTPWLWAHVITGKLFLGCCLIATSLGIWLIYTGNRAGLSSKALDRRQLIEKQIWSWLTLAFLFHSGMLMAGAVWAQDAWGRYWDWDPLETWAFGTWLCMAIALHGRSAFNIGPRGISLFAAGTFLLAFLTFFGVPFFSINPHQGAV